MFSLHKSGTVMALVAALATAALMPGAGSAADHNDPNAANSIFSDIEVSAADLYDLFGWPADDISRGEHVVLALTFASVPATGKLDPDLLYRVRVYTTPRVSQRCWKAAASRAC